MKKYLLSLSLAAVTAFTASAADFFDTSDPDKFLEFGVRVGVNTTNRTLSDRYANVWNHNSWGTGFEAGVVADINIKNYLSLQPGFFYESGSGAFAYQDITNHFPDTPAEPLIQFGKGRSYNFVIPVMGSVHFNILDELRWNVDFGPYLQIKLKSTFDGSFEYPMTTSAGTVYSDYVKTSKVDFGLKFGTSLDIYRHYYVGVHYMAGLCHAWSPGYLGGHNKAWVFTIGYNF